MACRLCRLPNTAVVNCSIWSKSSRSGREDALHGVLRKGGIAALADLGVS